MSNVLHGLVANNEAEDTLKEISRVTEHGGKLAIVEFKRQESPHGPPLSIRLSSDEVEVLVRRYGFSTRRAQEVGPDHYARIFRKR
jgi:ubiquinone/menaquinone biosynthesis C-methylase UbiE